MMNKKIVVSVIIPVFNAEDHLDACLESVINQSFRDIEIVIVNDGSTDSSETIISRYHLIDSRIRIVNQKNLGLSSARNHGIKISSGDYLMFVDSDDVIDVNMVSVLYKELLNSNSDIVASDINYFDTVSGKTIRIKKNIQGKNKDEIFLNLLSGKISTSACSSIFKKSLFIDNKIIFPEKRIYEDYATAYKLYYFANKIKIVNTPLYNYRQGSPGSITNNITKRHLASTKVIADEIYNFIIQKKLGVQAAKCAAEKFYSHLVWMISRLSNKNKKGVRSKIYKILTCKLVAHFNKAQTYNLALQIKKIKININDKAFSRIGINKNIIREIYSCKNSAAGIMELALKKIPATGVYVYGCGEIADLILPEMERRNIKILGLIDSAKTNKVINGVKIAATNIYESGINSNNYVIIASISSAEEIAEKIKYFNIEINAITIY